MNEPSPTVTKWPMLTRAMAVHIDHEARTKQAADDPRIPLSLSSEAPVDRWFGREILEHSKEAIDLSYAQHGLPFLADHDGREQIGILEDVTLGKDKKLRGWARPGNNPDAGWRFKDIRDGVRPHISVGYRVNTVVLERSDETGDTYRVTSWTPMEASTVAIPADTSVGVGRAADEQKTYPVQIIRRGIMPEHDTTVVARRDYDAEAHDYRTQIENLAKIGGLTPPELADAFRRKVTVDAFMRELQERAISQAANAPSVALQLTDREQKQYMLTRAIHAAASLRSDPRAWDKAGFEREVSDEIAKRAPSSVGGFFVPFSLQTRASVTGNVAATASLGGAGVQTTILDLIELLRNASVVRQAGARFLTGLTANITFPRQITPNVMAWTGENPSTPNANTAATFDTVAMTPKSAMVSTAASRQVITQQSFDMENMIREDMANVVALGLDTAALNGSGSANQPTGLINISGYNTVTTTFGSNGAVPDWAAVVAFETALATNNAPTGNAWRWVTTPGIRGKLRQVLQHTTGGASWIWGPDGKVLGYEALVSNQVPSNLTAGTSTTIAHAMALGNWAELLVAQWGAGFELLVDPYTVASQNMVQFHTFLMMDCNVRHPKSFAISKAALIA